VHHAVSALASLDRDARIIVKHAFKFLMALAAKPISFVSPQMARRLANSTTIAASARIAATHESSQTPQQTGSP
jgi:hypothetical protein